MTISLSRNFFIILTLAGSCWGAMASEHQVSVEVLSGGRSFDSFEAYAAFKAPLPVPEGLTGDVFVPAPAQDVLGVTSSLGQVVQDFEQSSAAGMPACPRDNLAQTLEQAADGKEGPLLLVADGNKVRIMELKHETGFGSNAGTKP